MIELLLVSLLLQENLPSYISDRMSENVNFAIYLSRINLYQIYYIRFFVFFFELFLFFAHRYNFLFYRYYRNYYIYNKNMHLLQIVQNKLVINISISDVSHIYKSIFHTVYDEHTKVHKSFIYTGRMSYLVMS